MIAGVTNTTVTLSSLIGGEWSNFALGALLLVAGLVVFALRSRPGAARRRPSRDLAAIMACLGALLTVTSAARLRGWTGSGNNTVHLVGMGIVIVMIVFAVRYLVRTPDSRIP
jgi:hypothetical protein